MELFAQKFELMYKAHYSLLRNTSENIVNDTDASHDIVQEVFLKLWHKKEDPAFILNQRAYLLRSVINASITHLTKNKRTVHLLDSKLEATENSDSALELEQNIKIALDKLPAKCKAIFVLSRFEGIKNKEIAELMGISLKTVENQMGIALKKMRADLKPFLISEFASMALAAGLSVWLKALEISNDNLLNL
jgi:RNA polymerase sigma-70 factor, ECF subfamily